MSIEWSDISRGAQVAPDFRAARSVDDVHSRIEARLSDLVPALESHPSELHRAMRYSLFAGGKRLRPVLTLQVAVELGASMDAALDVACAIEMVHTASLILDDLPCMDDAELRRGKVSNHRIFGEDTAILAATALLNRAFGVIAECRQLDPSVRLDLVRLLSDAVGSNGIIAGQYVDLRSDQQEHGGSGLTAMYAQKTGALFVAAVEAGARVAQADETGLRAVRSYAINLGLAFQILDDLLDAHGTAEDIGKDTGQDECKTTVVSHLGSDEAHREVRRYLDSAALALEPLGENGTILLDLANSYTERALERVPWR
jgi:geranylgeranyl diphosphate synthase type II